MAIFKFRLAAVLRFRKRLEEEKEWELGLILDERRNKEQEIAAIEAEQRHASDVSTAERGIVLSIVDLRQRALYDESLARAVQEKRAQLKQVDQAIAAKRAELLEALRHVRVLEQLRDRWLEKFQREQNTQEQKIADELSQRKVTRAADGNGLP